MIRYKHDCHICAYIGQHNQYDLYYCVDSNTVVARYGDKPEENKSGWNTTDTDLLFGKNIVMGGNIKS